MPFDPTELMNRLDAEGRRSAAERPEMPRALRRAVAAQGESPARAPLGRVPYTAVAAAVAVVMAGAWLAAVRPVVYGPGATGSTLASAPLPLDAVASILNRYKRGASIDAALPGPEPVGGGAERVLRAADSRAGELPE